MKKIKYLSFTLLIALLIMAISCTETSEGFLDDKSEGITIDQIFSDSLMTKQYLATVYWQIPSVLYAPRKAGWFLTDYEDYSSATDDGKEVSNNRQRFSPAFMKADFTQNGINADFEHFLNLWTSMYSNIRICNQVLESIDGAPLTKQTIEGMKLEARFLRAFYYFHLLRNFGGIPIVGDNTLSPFENYDLPRSSFEETVDYLATEFTYLSTSLPDVQNLQEYGRPTKGAALAMLVKLFHYAASPLSNGGNVGSGSNRLLVGYDDFQTSRWQRAKDAIDNFYSYNNEKNYYELIEEANGKGFYTATTSRSSKERIWFWLVDGVGGNTWPHSSLLPKSRSGSPKIVPYHELTEAFPTKDGVDIRDKDSQNKYYTSPGRYNEDNTLYDPDEPYLNRDPRFYYTFLYNGAMWRRLTDGSKEPVYTYRGAPNDGIFSSGSPTGYYYAKICKTDVIGNQSNSEVRGTGLAFIRYADILLMDAEVMTEIDYSKNKTKIEELLFKIRKRAGILVGNDSRYGIPLNLSKEEMIDFILNERRIEFVIEGGNRFWDLQRRKLFTEMNNKWSHAAVWEKIGEDNGEIFFTWSIQPVEQHYFQSKMYHLPIPLKEYGSAKGKLLQNPGW
ncbi:RagB/SusD family nutrient uptake outer membrane protein [Dysgonomonas sp. BGC7]|uniref:RagB/SusD family nutrient uptake outer membrane protein n=1 Tax=Dysgonomonas sp. BGC7 TaxID=1658008 RepID=UPI0009E5D36A|nr:RagB/SusD family nutrient uptake outer membrane protein [Dysgonomonas sp. BGC7]MBD8387568.1 RagB/SusD family nutrient uptake outer membrane protein [Dysgonomonas sp. BGC7]